MGSELPFLKDKMLSFLIFENCNSSVHEHSVAFSKA